MGAASMFQKRAKVAILSFLRKYNKNIIKNMF